MLKEKIKRGRIKMGIENEYEGKVVLVTGGAGCIGTNKLFFYKETFTKETKRRRRRSAGSGR